MAGVGDELFDGGCDAGVDFDWCAVGGYRDDGAFLAGGRVDVGFFAVFLVVVFAVVIWFGGGFGVGGCWCGWWLLGCELVVGVEPFGLVLAWGEGVAGGWEWDGVPFVAGGGVADVPVGSDEGDVAVGAVEDGVDVFEGSLVLDVGWCVYGSGVSVVVSPGLVGELVGA